MTFIPICALLTMRPLSVLFPSTLFNWSCRTGSVKLIKPKRKKKKKNIEDEKPVDTFYDSEAQQHWQQVPF